MRARSVAFSRFMEEVLDIYRLDAGKKTVAKMSQVLREFAELGLKSTADLKPAVIARWRHSHPGRAPATVDSLMRSLRAACEIGIASGYLRTSPLAVRRVWPELEPPNDEGRHHSLSDIRSVLIYLRSRAGNSWHDHRLYALAATVIYTGIRRNEALFLTTPDLDFEEHCIRIVARKKLKTKASAQPVGMPDELGEILKPWLPRTGSLWLFPGTTRCGPWTGGPPGYKPCDKLKGAGLAAGVAGFTFLSLRHSWATHAEAWGLGETMIQRQLRHTTRRMQQHYRHADVANIVSAVRSVSFAGGAAI